MDGQGVRNASKDDSIGESLRGRVAFVIIKFFGPTINSTTLLLRDMSLHPAAS